MMTCNKLHRQKGVAVVTALLLTTLAITIVASLFWQQQVQVRSIENQRFQLQKKWILRGALDWAALILREDARVAGRTDHLGEPWAVNLGETRLDQYVENGKSETEDGDATLQGQISDAQAKYNINNLALDGVVDVKEVKAFTRLLKNLQIDSSLAAKLALNIAATQEKKIIVPKDEKAQPSNQPTIQFVGFHFIDDLLAVPGFTPAIIEKLNKHVTVLPTRTRININTTTAEVLSARLENVSLSDAALIIARRDRAYFLEVNEIKLNFPNFVTETTADDISVTSSYFVINGKVKLNRSSLEVHALIRREEFKTQILWVKES
jgi:general secretion pathway protein K